MTNHLRLLRLDAEVASLVAQGVLSMGQARALAGLEDAEAQRAPGQAGGEGGDVRPTGRGGGPRPCKHLGGSPTRPPRTPASRSAYLDDLERQIREQLGTKVVPLNPFRKKGTGCLSIDFHSLEHFDGLLGRLGVKTE